MANNLMDLLADDDEEEDDIGGSGDTNPFHALLRGGGAATPSIAPSSSSPTGPSQQQPGARQITPAAVLQQGHQPSAAQAQLGAQAQTQALQQARPPGVVPNAGASGGLPAAQRPVQTAPQGQGPPKPPGMTIQDVIQWCKNNLPPEQVQKIEHVSKELKARVSKGEKGKDIYLPLYHLIGMDKLKECQRQHNQKHLAAAGLGGAPGPATMQSPQSGRPQAGTPAAASSMPGQSGMGMAGTGPQAHALRPLQSSIMQSLQYSAEQQRQQQQQQRVGAPRPAVQQQQWQGNGMQHQQAQAGNRAPTGPSAVAPGSQGLSAPNVVPRYSTGYPEQPSANGQWKAAAVQRGPTATPPVPSVLGKQPAEEPAEQHAAKKSKKDKDDDGDVTDILKDSGVNLEEEENALLSMRESAASVRPAVPSVAEPPFLNAAPLAARVLEITRRHGLRGSDASVNQLLSRAMEAHLNDLLESSFAMARQRADVNKRRPGMVATGDMRQRVLAIARRERVKQEAREKKEHDDLLQLANSKKKQQDEEMSKKAEKANKKEAEKQQASAANAAALSAFGSKAKWGAWGAPAAGKASKPQAKAEDGSEQDAATAEPAAKAASGSMKAAPGEVGAARAATPSVIDLEPDSTASGAAAARTTVLPPSGVKAGVLTAGLKDLVAVMERERMYTKSTLLYKLYEQL